MDPDTVPAVERSPEEDEHDNDHGPSGSRAMTGDVAAADEAAIRRRQTVRVATIAALVAIAAVLAIDNRQSVTINYLIGDAQAPLVVALIVAFVLGLLLGWLVAWRRHH